MAKPLFSNLLNLRGASGLWTTTGASGSAIMPTTGNMIVLPRPGSVIKSRWLQATNDATFLSCNYDFTTTALDDGTKPGWALELGDGTDDWARISRVPPAGTLPTLLLNVDNAGVVSVPGDGSSATTVLGSATAKGRVQATAALASLAMNRNAVTNTQDDGTKTSWTLLLSATTDLLSVQRAPAGSTTQTNLMILSGTSAPVGDLTITGNNATKNLGTAWINPSDERIKDNVQPYATGLAAIAALKPSTFTMNGKGGSTAGDPGIGLIAQEVEPVMPEMIRHYTYDDETRTRGDMTRTASATGTDYLALDQTALAMALVNAVQELLKRVEAIEDRWGPPDKPPV